MRNNTGSYLARGRNVAVKLLLSCSKRRYYSFFGVMAFLCSSLVYADDNKTHISVERLVDEIVVKALFHENYMNKKYEERAFDLQNEIYSLYNENADNKDKIICSFKKIPSFNASVFKYRNIRRVCTTKMLKWRYVGYTSCISHRNPRVPPTVKANCNKRAYRKYGDHMNKVYGNLFRLIKKDKAAKGIIEKYSGVLQEWAKTLRVEAPKNS